MVGITSDENKRESFFRRKYFGLHNWNIRQRGLSRAQAKWHEDIYIRDGYERTEESEDFGPGINFIVYTFIYAK